MGENWLVNFTLLAAMAGMAAIGAVYECKRVVGGRDAR
jgi:hypothetical protein